MITARENGERDGGELAGVEAIAHDFDGEQDLQHQQCEEGRAENDAKQHEDAGIHGEPFRHAPWMGVSFQDVNLSKNDMSTQA